MMPEKKNHKETLACFITYAKDVFRFLVEEFGFDGPGAGIVLGRQADVAYWKGSAYLSVKFDNQGPPWIVLAYIEGNRIHEVGLHQAMEERCPELMPDFDTRSFDEMMGDLLVYANALKAHFGDYLGGDGSVVFPKT